MISWFKSSIIRKQKQHRVRIFMKMIDAAISDISDNQPVSDEVISMCRVRTSPTCMDSYNCLNITGLCTEQCPYNVSKDKCVLLKMDPTITDKPSKMYDSDILNMPQLAHLHSVYILRKQLGLPIIDENRIYQLQAKILLALTKYKYIIQEQFQHEVQE